MMHCGGGHRRLPGAGRGEQDGWVTATTGGWPLVGREGVLGRLGRAIVEGEGSGVVVVGPAGVGKTRLVREALARAERAGLVAVGVRATRSASRLAFGAVAPLLGGGGAGPGPAGMRGWVETVARRAGGRRLVVFVDDAHLLDDASAALVHQLAVTGAAVVVVTVRAGAAVRDPIVALWKDGVAERMKVDRLDDRTVAELLAAVLGGPLDPEAARRLVDRCRGDLVLLRELVSGAMGSGALMDEGGRWRLRGPLVLSDRLVELVEARFDGIDRDARRLLELVAVADPLGYGELVALSDPGLAEALERHGLLASSVEGRRVSFRPAHPLYGDVLRERLPATYRRTAARSLAETLEGCGVRRCGDALRVASWRLVGGGGRPEILLAGATDAWSRCQLPLAEHLARAAVDDGGGFDARLLAAHVAALRGRHDQARGELDALAAQAGDDAQCAAVALARVHDPGERNPRDKLQTIDDAERSLTDPGWRDQLAAERFGQFGDVAGPRAALDAAGGLLDRLRGRPLARACVTAAYHLGRLGRLDDAHRAAGRGRAAERTRTGRPRPSLYGWWHEVMRAHALNHAGLYAEADRVVAAGHEQARVERSNEAEAVFTLMLAAAVGERGHARTAAERARQATGQLRQLGKPLLVRHGLTWQALALALGGRPREASDALAAIEELGLVALPLPTIGILQAGAWAAAVAGDLPGARRRLEQAVAVADDVGDLVGLAAALHGLARLGRAGEVGSGLAAVATHIEGDLAPARVVHTRALAAHDAAGLEEASRRFHALGADLLAAEAAADAAVARRQAGEARAATGGERRAHTLAEGCESPVTPALRGIRARAALTPGEREAALLAVRGLSNREIAERLYVSVRTVGNRLQRVYEKLGINRRSDLAEALDDAGAGP